MHRILIFFFSLWYLLLSGGVVASLHLCQGAVQELVIFGSQEEEEAPCLRCSTENGPHKEGCCDHSVAIVNITDEVPEVSNKELTFKVVHVDLPANFTAFANFSGTGLKKKQTYNKELLLRPLQGFPLHKLHCVYRI